jgi:hypothetical protein
VNDEVNNGKQQASGNTKSVTLPQRRHVLSTRVKATCHAAWHRLRPRGRGTTDPDEEMIAGALVRQMVAIAKNSLPGGPEDRDPAWTETWGRPRNQR